MPDSTSLPETNHLKIDPAAYDRLTDEAVSEIIRCLFANYPPAEITVEKVRNYVHVFAGSNLEAWTHPLGVIRHKRGGGDPTSNELQVEYRRLVRAVRTRLKDDLLQLGIQVWEDARTRAVNEAECAGLRVQQSSVHLHRLTSDHRYGQH